MIAENLLFQIIVFSTIALLLCVAVIGIIISISHKHRIEQDVKMKEISIKYEQELRQAEMEMNESVMKHIGREIHDNLAMKFTTANFGLNSVMFSFPEAKEDLEPIRETLNTGIEELRLFSRSLNKDFVFSKTLFEMIDIETARLTSIGKFQIHKNYDSNTLTISKNQELIVFRIFQELIQNILKHANAKNIFIAINSVNGFQLILGDDGVGFDMNSTSNKLNGIRNIIERAKLAELSCEFQTAPSRGCKVTIQKVSNS